MASQWRDRNSEDVQAFLDSVAPGAASEPTGQPAPPPINIAKAQTLARSSGNPQAQAQGQAMLQESARQSEQAARQAAADERAAGVQARRDQAEAKRVAAEQAAAIEAERARQVREGAALGIKTKTDIPTGKRTLATHPDGGYKFTPGPIKDAPLVPSTQTTAIRNENGDLQGVPASNPMIAGGDGVLGATGGTSQTTMLQPVQDNRGKPSLVTPDPTTDAKTGIQTISTTDPTTGQTVKTAVGIDEKAREQAQKTAEFERRGQEIELRELQTTQAKRRFTPRWEPVEQEFKQAEKAYKEFNTGEKYKGYSFQRQNGAWVKVNKETGKVEYPTEREVVVHQDQLEAARQRYLAARKQHDAMLPANENFKRAEAEIDEAKLKLKEDRIRMESGETEGKGGWARTLARLEAGETVLQSEADAALLEELGLNPADYTFEKDETSIQGPYSPEVLDAAEAGTSTVAPSTPELAGPPKPLVPLDDPAKAKLFADTFSGLANPEQFTAGVSTGGATFIMRDGKPVGTVDMDKAGAPVVILDQSHQTEGLRQLLAFGGAAENSAPIYLKDGPRKDVTKEAGYVKSVLEAVNNDPYLVENPTAANARLAMLGTSQTQIADKVKRGELSVQNGEAMMKSLYGSTLKPEDPLDKATFGKWISEADADTKQAWAKATASKDTEARNGVVKGFINDWFIANRHKPGVSFTSRLLAEKSLMNEKRFAEGLGGTIAEAAGSTAGMFATLTGLTYLPISLENLFGDKDIAQDAFEATNQQIGRAFANVNRGMEFNRKKWLTKEGKKRLSGYQKAFAELRSQIATQDVYADSIENPAFRDGLNEKWQKVVDAAYNLHAMGLEEGWEMTREDLQKLRWMATAYAKTGDAALIESLQTALLEDHGTRQAQDYLAQLTHNNGKLMSGIIAGSVAAPQEMLIEAATDLATGFVGTALLKGAKITAKAGKVAASANRMSNFRRFALTAKEDFAKLGMVLDTLANPASALGKATNLGVKGVKAGAFAAGSEFVDESIMAVGDRNASVNSVIEQGAMGALMGPILAGFFIAPGVISSNSRAKYDQAQAAADFATTYNKAAAGTDGFVPLTPEQAKTAMALVPPQLREKLTKERDAATQELLAAVESAKGSTDAAVLSRLSKAQARSLVANDMLATEAAMRAEAVQAVQSLDPAEQDFANAVAKVASGRADLLTATERKAAGAAMTSDGKPFFASVNGRDVVTDAGRAESMTRFREIGLLIQTTESQALFEASTTPAPNEQDPQGQQAAPPADSQPAPTDPDAPVSDGGDATGAPDTGGTGATPQGQAPAVNPAEMDAGIYESQRATNPDLPSIQSVVKESFTAGRPVSVSMAKASGLDMPEGYTRQGSLFVPRKAEESAPIVLATTQEQKNQAKMLSETLKAELEESMPNLKGRILIETGENTAATGGVVAYSNGTVSLLLRDVAVRIKIVGLQAARTELRVALVRHEIMHAAQYQWVSNEWQKAGKPGTFDAFWNKTYGTEGIFGELEKLPGILNLFKQIYDGKRVTEDGASAWEQIPTDANKAAEGVRMLLEIYTDPKRTKERAEISELLRAEGQQNSKLVAMLQEVIAHLGKLLDAITGKESPVSEVLKEHLNGVQALYNELTSMAKPAAATDKTTPKAAAKPEPAVQATPQQPTPQDTAKAENPPPAEATSKESPPAPEEETPTALFTTGQAIVAALQRHPLLKADPKLSEALFDLTAELSKVVEGMDPAARRGFLDTAIDEWVEGMEAVKEAKAKEAQAAKNAARHARVKAMREAAKARLRDKARAILNSDVHEVLSAIFAKGTITPKPNAVGLILARQKNGAKLTEKEMGIIRNVSDFNGMPRKQDYPGGGNNAVIREILDMLYARAGQGQMPNVMADKLIPNMETASEMFEQMATELRTLSRGKKDIAGYNPMDDPNYEPTDAEIAEWEAKQAALAEQEAAPLTQPYATIDDVHGYAIESFGPDAEITRKIGAVADHADRFSRDDMPTVRAIIAAEFARHAAGKSIPEWDAENPAIEGPAAGFLKAMRTHTAESLNGILAGLPIIDAGAALFSSPSPINPGRINAVQMPPAVIGHSLAATKHPEYPAAKAGDPNAALRVARDLVTPQMRASVKSLIGESKPVIVPVVAMEATGNNMIPQMVAIRLEESLGLTSTAEIVQSVRAHRSDKSGLDRVFSQPEFSGPVKQGETYLLVDDTLTQGGTFAALADYITRNGGKVIGAVALTGKQYSATLQLSEPLLTQLRKRLGDLEDTFRTATGHGFDRLTESEARTLVSYGPLERVRARILEAASTRGDGLGPLNEGQADSSLGSSLSSSPSPESPGRFRPKTLVEFAKPYRGPSGASLVAYEWKHELKETVDKRGEDSAVRVSNWNESATNWQTGREIVHQFHVTSPNGETRVTSLETALKLMGYTSENGVAARPVRSMASTLRNRSLLAMEAEALRPMVEESKATAARYEKELAALQRERMPKPVFTKDGTTPIMRIGPLEKWGNLAGTPESFAKRSEYDLRSLENEWRMEEAKARAGGKGNYQASSKLSDLEARIAKLDRKIQEQSAAGSETAPQDTAPDLFSTIANLPPGPMEKFVENTSKAYEDAKTDTARENIAKTAAKREGMTNHGKVQNLPQGMMDFGMSGSFGTKEQPGLFSSPTAGRFSQEKADILKIAPRGKDEHPLAPNGQRSNLTEDQWATVRTKNFKRWFGDWEGMAKRDALRNSRDTLLTGNEVADFSALKPTDSLKPYREKAKEWAETNLPQTITNQASGMEIELRRSGVASSLEHGSGPGKIQSIAALPDLLKNGIVLDRSRDADGRPITIHTLGAKLNIETHSYVARMVVREDQNGKLFYDHELSTIESLDALSESGAASQEEVGQTGARRGKENLLRSIFSVNPETVSKVVDENGEPLVVYHGSKEAGFDTFDPSMADSRQRPDSVFFSDSRRTARTYSGSLNDVNFTKDEDGEPIPHRAIYAVFLNIRNPNEAHFEGANWDGTRTGQFIVMDAEGEQLYSDSGRGYFADEEDAQVVADMNDGAEVVPAEDGFKTTNSVAMDASRYGNDGAIIYEVIDDGGEAETYDTSTVFVAFDANQVKSADANNGQFSSDPSILFSSPSNQRSFDFGATGGFNTRNQPGFDFSETAKPATQPELTSTDVTQTPPTPTPEPGTADFRLLPREDKAEIVKAKVQAKAAEKAGITDFGEKIGGARKDNAGKSDKPATKKKTTDKPGWFNRYEVNEVVAESKPSSPLESYLSRSSGMPSGDVGRFVINDKRKTDWRGQPERATRQTFATREEAEAYIPIIEVSRNHRVRKGEDSTYGIWRTVTDRKRVQVVKQTFDTEKEAMEFMAKNAADIIETKTSWREELIVKPEKAVRSGPERRKGPATPEMFQEAFGFRGVEFGNWMRQAGDGKERQEVLNHAYDGLIDLAELLGIPPRAISLNGELGLAFGARGQGLSGAKAHYEPDYVVINLTKMSGAGSLAHEWIHALDHYLGRQDGRASSQLVKNKDGDMVLNPGAFEENAVSTRFSRDSKVRDEVKNAFVQLMDTIMTKSVEYVEDSNKAENFVSASRKALEDNLQRLRKEYTRDPDPRWEKRRKPATEAQRALFESIADRLMNGQDLATDWRGIDSNARGGKTYRWTNDTLEQLGALHKQITNRSGFDTERKGWLDDLRGYMERYRQRIAMLESAAASETKVKKVPTDFSMNAKRIDQGSASDYWNVPHEMLARGFSAYVEDRIAASGGTSDFLSYGSDNSLEKYRIFNVKPFPEGPEREAINEKFDNLFGVIETRETDKGIALFSSPAPSDGVGKALQELARHDEVFRYPVSSKSSLRAVMAEVFPDARFEGDDTRPDEAAESGADKRTVFSTIGKDGQRKLFYVYETDETNPDVWIDVSRLTEGERGSAIYAAVGNYAHNAGGTFIGDPAGLSEAATVRRTSAMLSLALRFGTTDFMEPSKEQLAGGTEKGIAALEWKGNDQDKVRALIQTFLSNLHAQYPGIRNASYDFGTGQFLDRMGRPLRREDPRFDKAGGTNTGRAARAGEATLRRGIFLQSLVSSEGGQGPNLLGQLLNRANPSVTDAGLGRLFSSPSPQQPGPHQAGFEIPARHIVEGFMSPDFKYRIGESFQPRPGHRLITSDFAQYKEGKYKLGLYRLVLLENPEGNRYVEVEKGIGNDGNSNGETLTFERMRDDEIKRNRALSERSQKLWEDNPADESSLFDAAPNLQADLFTAANAPDAAQMLGSVKVGTMNALGAYRTLTAKRDAGKALSADEEQKLLAAEEALGQKLAFDMESVKGNAPATGKQSSPVPPPAFGSNRRDVQDEISRAGEIDRGGQMSLLSSPSPSPNSSWREVFHSGSMQDAYDPTKADMDAQYGPGFYSAEDPKRAEGYGKAKPRKLWIQASNTFDHDARVSRQEAERILATTGEDPAIFDWLYDDEVKSGTPVTGEDVWNVIKDQLSPMLANDALQLAGYDSATYTGNRGKDRDWIVFKPEQIKTSNPSSLAASPSPDTSAAVQQALEKMPPIYRQVFEAVNAGATEADVMARFNISPTAVTNILNSVRSRIVIATKAAADTLKPEMRDGKFDGGRPDLAEGAQPDFVAVDQIRNESAIPGGYSRNDSRAEARRRLDADYEGEFDRLFEKQKDGIPPDDIDVAMAKEIFNREVLSGGLTDPQRRTKVALSRVAYRDQGSAQSRAFSMRIDENLTPAERNAMHLAELLYEPSPDVQTRMEGADEKTKDSILKKWMAQIDAFKAEMKAEGIDIDASLAEFNESQQARKQAAEESPRAAAAVEETIRKLSPHEKMVIESIRSGGKLTSIEKLTGLDADTILDINARFNAKIRESMVAAAKRFLAGSLASSPVDMMTQILAELGVWNNDMIDDRVPGIDERRKEVLNPKPRKAKPATPKKPEPPKIRDLTPEEQAALDAAFERFRNTPPAQWKTFWQEEMKTLAPMIGQKSFEEFKGAAIQPWRDLWQTEMDGISTPPARMTFEEWLAKPENADRFGTAPELFSEQEASGMTPEQIAELDQAWERFKGMPANQQRTLMQTESAAALWTPEQKAAFEAKMQGEISDWTQMKDLLEKRQSINKTTGTFDMNNPQVMSHIANEWARRNGTWINKATEWFKMSILSGVQTILINALGGLHVGYQVGPRRAMEAGWNDLLGLFGTADVRSATMGEFMPMLKNVRSAMSLAARNGIRSWQLESPVFDSYAEARPIQLDFTGVGAEFSPPALSTATLSQLKNDPSFKNAIGVVNGFLRNITFRELTMTDEFWKGMYSQLDVAAIAHRIAAKEEKLTGDAYAARTAELMKTGSEAWRRAIPRTKNATFQDPLAYGKWTKEDEKRNPAHKAGTTMTWGQALGKSETESAWTLLDAIAAGAVDARKIPFIGPILHMFALPFIITPKNLIQRGLEVTPLGLVVDIIDGMRSLRRRLYSGNITAEESRRIAGELYNQTRFVQLLTNQSIGIMAYLALESLSNGDDDDEAGRPWITGTMPYTGTKKGERDNAMEVMPAQSFRIGDTIIPYKRLDPFSTAISSMVDMAVSLRRNNGEYNAQVVSDAFTSMKEQMKDKLFLKGLGDIISIIEDPDRGADRLAAGYITAFIPNFVRQPVRETDSVVRNKNPMADAGFFEAIGQRVGHDLMPQAAPPKIDTWGDPIPANRGDLLGGMKPLDAAFRILDPLNVTFGGKVRPISAWIYRYNLMQPRSKDRIGIEPYQDEINVTFPGQRNPTKIALTPEEVAAANRNIGKAALAILGNDWDWRTTGDESATQKADQIRDVFTKLKRNETQRIKMEKFAAGLPPQE